MRLLTRLWPSSALTTAVVAFAVLLVACSPAAEAVPAAATPATQQDGPAAGNAQSSPAPTVVIGSAVSPSHGAASEPLSSPTATPAPTVAPLPTVASTDPLVPTVAPDRITPEAESGLPAGGDTAIPLLPPPAPGSMRSRLGVSVPIGVARFDEEMVRRLGPGWYLDWTVQPKPVAAENLEFAQVVLMRGGGFYAARQQVADAIRANPGALWFISNEPDVPWQDDVTPETYALQYHQYYTYIKSLDPSARVAAGGLSQPTALRLRYLDRVMAAYERRFGAPLPADAWHLHAFILREERDSWGVGIPRGFHEDQGELFEIEDHDDLEIFRRQIVDFRRWMAANGQQDKPLIVSEYGILMPADYGFPPERVADFMEQSFDFLLLASDPEIGYPADQGRLVQRLAWFNWSDTVYPTGNLIEPGTDRLTLLGRRFADYAARLDQNESKPD